MLSLLFILNSKMLSDQAIISGIRIGGTRESEAIQAIYNNFSFTLQKYISLNQDQLDATIIWETVECFVNGVKNDLVRLSIEEGRGIEFYLNKIGQKIKYPEVEGTPEVETFFDDKLVWDYYINLLSESEGLDSKLLTRSFGKGTSIVDLAEKLVAKGDYNTVEEVKEEKYNLLTNVLSKL